MRVRSSEGPEFDCHLALPKSGRRTPAVVLASAIHGVDADLVAIAGLFASRGYIALAPDLFWRTVPGPLARGDARSVERSEPRDERLRRGERDLVDVLRRLEREPRFNGRALLMGFCYGGPYAVIGPRRLGYDAGIACHGTGMLEVAGDAHALQRPVHILWGDQDRMAPGHVVDAYRAIQAHCPCVAVHLFAGVRHGYMMRTSPAFDANAYGFSIERALELLARLAVRGRPCPAAGTP